MYLNFIRITIWILKMKLRITSVGVYRTFSNRHGDNSFKFGLDRQLLHSQKKQKMRHIINSKKRL